MLSLRLFSHVIGFKMLAATIIRGWATFIACWDVRLLFSPSLSKILIIHSISQHWSFVWGLAMVWVKNKQVGTTSDLCLKSSNIFRNALKWSKMITKCWKFLHWKFVGVNCFKILVFKFRNLVQLNHTCIGSKRGISENWTESNQCLVNLNVRLSINN